MKTNNHDSYKDYFIGGLCILMGLGGILTGEMPIKATTAYKDINPIMFWIVGFIWIGGGLFVIVRRKLKEGHKNNK